MRTPALDSAKAAPEKAKMQTVAKMKQRTIFFKSIAVVMRLLQIQIQIRSGFSLSAWLRQRQRSCEMQSQTGSSDTVGSGHRPDGRSCRQSMVVLVASAVTSVRPE